MDDPLEPSKRNAIAFYDLMFNRCRPAEAVARYVGEHYPQHNPHVADGSLVVLHCRQEWPTDAHKDWAGIDIFRFTDDGKIVEHWDVLQVGPAHAAHDNGMF